MPFFHDECVGRTTVSLCTTCAGSPAAPAASPSDVVVVVVVVVVVSCSSSLRTNDSGPSWATTNIRAALTVSSISWTYAGALGRHWRCLIAACVCSSGLYSSRRLADLLSSHREF